MNKYKIVLAVQILTNQLLQVAELIYASLFYMWMIMDVTVIDEIKNVLLVRDEYSRSNN